jgi:hypothetical protein
MKTRVGWAALLIGFVGAGSAEAQNLDWVRPSLAGIPSVRSNASMAYDADTQTIVLFGGNINNGQTAYGDTWLFTRALGWTPLSPAASPSPRSGSGFAYDCITRTVVLFGGFAPDGSASDDTWTWNGITWTQQLPAVSPPARGFNTDQMAFDTATGTAVLFGGSNSSGQFLGDTWVWHGVAKTWTQKFPAASPSPRQTTLAYDGVTQQIVLFGGGDNVNPFFGDTWTWDGVTWSEQFPPSSPSARVNHSMAYDASLGRVTLFGGYSAIGGFAFNDTWFWNGTTWSQVQTPISPAGRYGSAMTYDPHFGGLVLFGGYFTGGPYTNQTWLFR